VLTSELDAVVEADIHISSISGSDLEQDESLKEQIYFVAESRFEAARRVEILPEGHRSRRLHGHSFLAKVSAQVPENRVVFAGAEVDFLRTQLQHVVSGLDYRNLNEIVTVPSDENLARWVRSQLAQVPNVDLVGMQSTADQGADLDARNCAHIWKRYRFEAAHRLPNVSTDHPCGRMHGHGFEVILHANQSLGDRDMGIDFDQLDGLWGPLDEELHLSCLNDIPGLSNPTSEIIGAWIWQRLKPQIPQLSWVTVYETTSAGCHYDGENYRIWKEQRFESAMSQPQAPAGDRRKRLHGHSYVVRLHVTSPLHEVLGWTVDYGDVKQMFRPVYEAVDHHRLDRLEGLADFSIVGLLRFIRSRMTESLPNLDRIDLYETPGCGAFLQWGENRPALPANSR